MVRGWLILFLLGALCSRAANENWVSATAAHPNDFALVKNGHAADLLIAPEDFKVVAIAAADLATDIERVTGQKPVVKDSSGIFQGMSLRETPAPRGDEAIQLDRHGALRAPRDDKSMVLIGTLGKSASIDLLVASGRLDVSALRGQWETFLIATFAHPFPGVENVLVVVGSDRRGTAYGVYELAQAIGVSPWHWWADVGPEKKAELFVTAGVRKFGPPSVRYRGIFINDEDWGLQPWAAKTFAPEEKGIGPKTYKKVFELLLRLKANTLWPAMHAVSPPFNSFPQNAQLADDYAIVMGSSHAEPMLRNNVGEWKAPAEDYDYVKNRDGVRRYWDERVASNGRFENIYTIGMRGIHDSGMVGPKSDAERIRVLEQVFADQRAMLAARVNPQVARVPQIFCAYKEVLDLYRGGLHVPDDVTIMWPDDNFGYVRNFATAEEQKRAGGFGIYYHLSYLGKPLSYLWLSTTPPALIWSEMTKAYEHGARQIWIANVGDIKPAEIDTEFFLQLAWDVNRWRADNVNDFLKTWATREFGAEHATEIASIMAEYYLLNFQRKPEHLQWWLPGETPRPSPLSKKEVTQRLTAFMLLTERAMDLHVQMPRQKWYAFFQLVVYPVMGASGANERYFRGEGVAKDESYENFVRIQNAKMANADLVKITDFYDQNLNGKWRHLMQLEPADKQWSSMRIAPWAIPDFSGSPKKPSVPSTLLTSVPVENKNTAGRWTEIRGLGKSGHALTVLPTTAPILSLEHYASAPQIDYAFVVKQVGETRIEFALLPTHSIQADRGLRFAVAVDEGKPSLIEVSVKDGGPEWAQGVLNAGYTLSVSLNIASPGRHVLRLYGLEPGVVIDRVSIPEL